MSFNSFYITFVGNNCHFPDVEEVKRKLSQFEKSFVTRFVERYSELSETVQLSALAIAIRLGPTDVHPLSLWQYFNSDDVPIDLIDPSNSQRYRLVIPDAMFSGVMHVRRSSQVEKAQRIALAQELATCLGVEVASELSRIYEYQIVMLSEGLIIDLLSFHAVDCTLDYLKSGNRFLGRNNLIEGVVYGFSRDSRLDPKYVSVVIGDRELKWDLHEVFKKCGLRREAVPAGVQQQVSWTYFTSANCLPILYGYRGILVEKDLATGNFIVGAEEDGLFPQEADWNPEDFHRHYVPFRRTDGVVEERSRSGNEDDCQTDTDSAKNRQRFIRNSNPMVSHHPLRKSSYATKSMDSIDENSVKCPPRQNSHLPDVALVQNVPYSPAVTPQGTTPSSRTLQTTVMRMNRDGKIPRTGSCYSGPGEPSNNGYGQPLRSPSKSLSGYEERWARHSIMTTHPGYQPQGHPNKIPPQPPTRSTSFAQNSYPYTPTVGVQRQVQTQETAPARMLPQSPAYGAPLAQNRSYKTMTVEIEEQKILRKYQVPETNKPSTRPKSAQGPTRPMSLSQYPVHSHPGQEARPMSVAQYPVYSQPGYEVQARPMSSLSQYPGHPQPGYPQPGYDSRQMSPMQYPVHPQPGYDSRPISPIQYPAHLQPGYDSRPTSPLQYSQVGHDQHRYVESPLAQQPASRTMSFGQSTPLAAPPNNRQPTRSQTLDRFPPPQPSQRTTSLAQKGEDSALSKDFLDFQSFLKMVKSNTELDQTEKPKQQIASKSEPQNNNNLDSPISSPRIHDKNFQNVLMSNGRRIEETPIGDDEDRHPRRLIISNV